MKSLDAYKMLFAIATMADQEKADNTYNLTADIMDQAWGHMNALERRLAEEWIASMKANPDGSGSIEFAITFPKQG